MEHKTTTAFTVAKDDGVVETVQYLGGTRLYRVAVDAPGAGALAVEQQASGTPVDPGERVGVDFAPSDLRIFEEPTAAGSPGD